MTNRNGNVKATDGASARKLRFDAILVACTSWRWFHWVVLAIICGLGFTYRCLHLLRPDHYYIISADSYFFHFMADLVASGDKYLYPTQFNTILPYFMHSGLTYPVGLLGKAVAFVSRVAPDEAVALAAKVLPPLLAVVTIVVLWLVVRRMYGRTVAHLSAFAFAASVVAIFFGVAGYLDRDGLSWLLVLLGVCSFYLMKDLHFKRLGRDFGWVLRCVLLLSFVALLYVEWGFLGSIVLMVVVAAYVIGEVMASLWPRLVTAFNAETDPLSLPMALAKEGAKRLVPSIKESSCAPLVLAFAVSAIVAIIQPGYKAIYNAAQTAFFPAEGAQYVAELRGIGPGDIVTWQFLLVPLLVGVYVAIRRRQPPDILWLSWFVVLFVGGLFARRFFNFATPAMCVLSGIGFAAMLDIRGARRPSLTEIASGLADGRAVLTYIKPIAAVFLIAVTILGSALTSRNVGSFSRIMSVTPAWEEALLWMRDEQNTPEDSKIVSWWDYGYWILDVAHRVPVVDNGIHWPSYDRDIARVYCATSDDEAAGIMQNYGARYFIFSEIEIRILPVISWEAYGEAYGDQVSIPRELRDSLFARTLSGQAEFGGGLRRVYPAADVTEPSVVILALE